MREFLVVYARTYLPGITFGAVLLVFAPTPPWTKILGVSLAIALSLLVQYFGWTVGRRLVNRRRKPRSIV